jgi:hypothetical protein
LLTVSRSFMNVANSVLWRMAVILMANKVNLFVSSVSCVFCYHSPNFLDTPRIMTNVMHKSAGYGVSARAPTPYPGDLNHCRNCTPASEDGLKESPKRVRQK